MAIALAACLTGSVAAGAQTPNQQKGNGQKPASVQQPSKQPPAQQPPSGNPFPEDENAVPVLPSGSSPANSPGVNGEGGGFPAPATDNDPVRSPDEALPADNSSGQGFSSSTSGLSDAAPPDDETGRKGKKQDDSVLEPPPETSKEDINVGSYYMDNKDWKGALSRFQSAMVLAPDNPDVYWGLAVCEEHLGDFADARANYLKVMEYDPGSHHAKEAQRALRNPEIANAKPAGK